MDKYQIVELIGEGSFGRVFRGLRKSDGIEVALKLIPKLGHSEKELSSLRSECKIQMSLSHPNIVRMLDAFETPKEVVAVTEFIPNGDLNKLLVDASGGSKQRKRPLPVARVRQIAGNLISALHYMHARRVLHRDLKPANVLVGKDGVTKLCDFGFARHLGLETMVLTSIKGTPLYMAPELIEERPYDHSADLWSAGAIIYELAVGHPPFPTNSLFQLIKKIRYEQVLWPEFLPPDLKSFLQGLLEKDCKRRFKWKELLAHPFVKDLIVIQEMGATSLTEALTASQELAKEIQRQDKSKLLPGGSQTLIKVAQKYEEQKKRLMQEAALKLREHPRHNKGRRNSEVAALQQPQLHNPHMARRPSNLAEYYAMQGAHNLPAANPLSNAVTPIQPLQLPQFDPNRNPVQPVPMEQPLNPGFNKNHEFKDEDMFSKLESMTELLLRDEILGNRDMDELWKILSQSKSASMLKEASCVLLLLLHNKNNPVALVKPSLMGLTQLQQLPRDAESAEASSNLLHALLRLAYVNTDATAALVDNVGRLLAAMTLNPEDNRCVLKIVNRMLANEATAKKTANALRLCLPQIDTKTVPSDKYFLSLLARADPKLAKEHFPSLQIIR